MKHAAGILPYRIKNNVIEVFLAHPGGPLWEGKDNWGIIKGEFDPTIEEPLSAALREFQEETSLSTMKDTDPFIIMPPYKQSSEKRIYIYLIECDFNAIGLSCNTFEMEWPRGSGVIQSYLEVDNWEWIPVSSAMLKIFSGQRPVLEFLTKTLALS